MPIRLLARRLLAVAVLVAAWSCQPASAQPPARTVLAIHWGAEDFPGSTLMDAAIRAGLESGAPVNYYAEYLETETFAAESASLALRDYIRQKFADRPVDVVVANSTPALQFALDHRHELFPGVPIVFIAGRLSASATNSPQTGVTGLRSDVAFAETLELALQLHPSVERVFLVAQSPTDAGYVKRVLAELQPLSQRVQLQAINEKSVSGLLAAVKALPPRSLILYTRYQPANTDHVVYPDEIVRRLVEVSPVPIYGVNDLYIGTGVVGGMMRGNRATGRRVAEMIRQIFDGTPPDRIPIESVPLVPAFDWRQLRRWGVDLSRLPPGSDVQFRTPTAWEAYRPYLIATIAVVIAQLLLIAGLFAQIARRQRAEETVLAREATLRTSYERIRQLAGRLIHAQEAARAGIARDLHDDLCQKLAYVAVGVGSLKSSSAHIQDAQTQQALSELERDTNRVFDGIRRLSHDLHPATLRLLGLGPALKAYCLEVERRHGVVVSFTAEGDLGSVHPDVALCFFRIVQEAITNGHLHGRARRFTVAVAVSAGYVDVTVTDDGRGFDLDAAHRSASGLGLVSIEERARLVDGEVTIVTAPGHGTTVRARAPVAPPRAIDVADAETAGEAIPADPFLAGGR